MGRWLGLDVGKKRIGVALSDPMKVISSPNSVIVRDGLEYQRISELVKQKDVELIVVGLPITKSGDVRGEMVGEIEKFVDKLRRFVDVPIETFDERFTTDFANRVLKGEKRAKSRYGKGLKDMISAQKILADYIQSRNT